MLAPDELVYDSVERITESCAAWLEGIRRHQIREVQFSVLIAGEDFAVAVQRHSDGAVSATFTGEETPPLRYITAPRQEWGGSDVG